MLGLVKVRNKSYNCELVVCHCVRGVREPLVRAVPAAVRPPGIEATRHGAEAPTVTDPTPPPPPPGDSTAATAAAQASLSISLPLFKTITYVKFGEAHTRLALPQR